MIFSGENFLRNPIFFLCGEVKAGIYIIAEYVLEEKTYQLAQVETYTDYLDMFNISLSDQLIDYDRYCKDLFAYENILFKDENPIRIVEKLNELKQEWKFKF